MTPRLADVRTRQLFWEAASSGDTAAGREVVRQQLDAGIAGSEIITHLLVPTQEAVGLEWQHARWSVAEEHAATAVADAALAVVEGNLRQDRVDGPFIIVVCAESEWHVLPARLATELACENGARARFLGPSLPANHLQDYLTRLRPDALAVSATLPTSLVGAANSITAARSAGVPVLAGGAGFGVDGQRAKALSADGWVSDARDLASAVTNLRVEDSATPAGWDGYHSVQRRTGAAAGAYRRLMDDHPQLHDMTAHQQARTREDFEHILEFLAVSLLVADPRVMQEFTEWLCVLLEARHLPRTTTISSYRALATQLDDPGRAVLLELADDLAGAG